MKRILYFPYSHFLFILDGWENIKVFTFTLNSVSKMSLTESDYYNFVQTWKRGECERLLLYYRLITSKLIILSSYCICHCLQCSFNQGWPWLHIELWFSWQPFMVYATNYLVASLCTQSTLFTSWQTMKLCFSTQKLILWLLLAEMEQCFGYVRQFHFLEYLFIVLDIIIVIVIAVLSNMSTY